MFARVGSLSIRYRWVVIALWTLIAVLMVLFAPPLSQVGVTDQEAFLPADAPSVRAGHAIYEKFPRDTSVGDTIVFFRAEGLTDSDMTYAEQIAAWLLSGEAPEEVSDVISVFASPELAPMLKSADGTTMLMSIEFSTSVSSAPTHEAVRAIRGRTQNPPTGLQVYTAGSASIVTDTLATVEHSLERTTWATVLLVIIILLAIYRSPVAALLPLLTISIAYLVSRGTLGYMAQAGVRMSTQMDIFAVVVVFGVGTDYCLFIVSRYREELHRLPSRFEAGVRTMEKIGAVIAASATVVVLGFLFLNVANFGMTRTMGTGLAVAVFVTLLAGLTLTPALMSVMGASLFWPFSHHQQRPEHGFWHRLALGVSRHAAWIVPVVIVVLLIPYVALPQMVRSFDVLGDVPADMESVKGFNTLKGHFDPGELFPTNVMLVVEDGLAQEHLAELDALAEQLRAVPGVVRVRSLLTPTGQAEEARLFTVDGQLSLMSDGINQAMAAFGGGAATGAASLDPVATMQSIGTYLKDLAAKYPEVAGTASYKSALSAAQALGGQLAHLESQMLVTTQLETAGEQIGMLAVGLRSPMLIGESQTLAEQTGGLVLLKHYLEGLAETFPFVAGEPSYQSALVSLGRVEASLEQMQKGLFVSGQLTIIADGLDELAKKLDNPMSLLQADTGKDLSALQSYLAELAQRYPWVASEASYTRIGTHFGSMVQAATKLQGGQLAAPEMFAALASLKADTVGMSQAVRDLSTAFADRDPTAAFIPKEVPAGMLRPGDAAVQVESLGLALLDLAKVFAARQPDARYVTADMAGSGDLAQAGAALSREAQALSAGLLDLGQQFAGRNAYLYPKALLGLYPGAQGLEKAFISEDGTAMRMYLILEPDPYSTDALDVSAEVRRVADATVEGTGSEVYITGSSIAFTDIRQVSDEDFVKVLLLTSLGVLLVMVILLRAVVAPIYLVVTVLLSYGSTLGLAVFVFQVLLGHDGINLLLPTMVLVLLVALGADYNIFLMARVREETEGIGFEEGLVHATSRTGSIITSCGIVLAGTFATMMLSPMTMLLQMGATVAFGVLLDTFVIRGILVPAIARLLKSRNWWPARK